MENYREFIKRKNDAFRKEKLISIKDIGRKGKHIWAREAWTFMPQSNLKEKVFIIERFRRVKIMGTVAHPKWAKKNDLEYRFGYYIIGKIGTKKGKWTWGQYCPLIPIKDFNKLLRKATKEGTII